MSDAIQVRTTGPMFDGSLARATEAGTQQAGDDVAGYALATIRTVLHGRLKHPTGAYERRIIIDRAGADRVVTDRRDVKGPWLEGVSRRNQTTRFKGYQVWRRTTQLVEARADTIAEAAVHNHIGGMT